MHPSPLNRNRRHLPVTYEDSACSVKHKRDQNNPLSHASAAAAGDGCMFFASPSVSAISWRSTFCKKPQNNPNNKNRGVDSPKSSSSTVLFFCFFSLDFPLVFLAFFPSCSAKGLFFFFSFLILQPKGRLGECRHAIRSHFTGCLSCQPLRVHFSGLTVFNRQLFGQPLHEVQQFCVDKCKYFLVFWLGAKQMPARLQLSVHNFFHNTYPKLTIIKNGQFHF